ncbi:hypothetical protein ACLOJK_000383 [Asimina triloba]
MVLKYPRRRIFHQTKSKRDARPFAFSNMSGYPTGYGYGAPGAHPSPYGSDPYAPPPQPYGAQPQASYGTPYAVPYAPGEKPPKEGKHQHGGMAAPYGAPSGTYGAPSAPYGAPSAPYGAPGEKPPKEGKYQAGGMAPPAGAAYPGQPYGNPFASLVPSAFPPGTDPNLVSSFQMADQDGSGFIDDKELQRALSSYNQAFSLRTVHLLMYLFTNSNVRKIGEPAIVLFFLQFLLSLFEIGGGGLLGTDPLQHRLCATWRLHVAGGLDTRGTHDTWERRADVTLQQNVIRGFAPVVSKKAAHVSATRFLVITHHWSGSSELEGIIYIPNLFACAVVNAKAIFERFDRDRSGKIDASELREALLSLGFSVSPVVLDLLVSKFDKTGCTNKAIEYDNFIECCLTVKGLTEKFKEKDVAYSGSATFTYEAFMLTVLPFLRNRVRPCPLSLAELSSDPDREQQRSKLY